MGCLQQLGKGIGGREVLLDGYCRACASSA